MGLRGKPCFQSLSEGHFDLFTPAARLMGKPSLRTVQSPGRREKVSGKVCYLFISHLEGAHITSAHTLLAEAHWAAILLFKWAAGCSQSSDRARIFVNSPSDHTFLHVDEHVAA